MQLLKPPLSIRPQKSLQHFNRKMLQARSTLYSDPTFLSWSRHQANNDTLLKVHGHWWCTGTQRWQTWILSNFNPRLRCGKNGRTPHTGHFKACCLEQESSDLVQVYANKDIIMSNIIPVVNYQSLSRLLYCNQLQLNEAEYFINSGMVTYLALFSLQTESDNPDATCELSP